MFRLTCFYFLTNELDRKTDVHHHCAGKTPSIILLHIIQYLGNSGFFGLWDPEIDGFTRGAGWTGGWRRESVHVLTFTIDYHVCSLVKGMQWNSHFHNITPGVIMPKDQGIFPS